MSPQKERFTKEQTEWLIRNASCSGTNQKLTEKFNRRFNTNRSVLSIKGKRSLILRKIIPAAQDVNEIHLDFDPENNSKNNVVFLDRNTYEKLTRMHELRALVFSVVSGTYRDRRDVAAICSGLVHKAIQSTSDTVIQNENAPKKSEGIKRPRITMQNIIDIRCLLRVMPPIRALEKFNADFERNVSMNGFNYAFKKKTHMSMTEYHRRCMKSYETIKMIAASPAIKTYEQLYMIYCQMTFSKQNAFSPAEFIQLCNALGIQKKSTNYEIETEKT